MVSFTPKDRLLDLIDPGDRGEKGIDLGDIISVTPTGAIASQTLADKLGQLVNVHDFGAIGDGTSHKLSERFTTLALAKATYPHAFSLDDEIDWAAWQGAIDYAGRLPRGGTVVGLAKTYIVHLTTYVAGVAGYRIAALSVPYSRVRLLGAGENLTTIKCRDNRGVYGVAQFVGPRLSDPVPATGTVPAYLENGIFKIFSSGFSDLTLDGNFDGYDIDGPSTTLATGIYGCEFKRATLKNSRGYGFGLENGAHKFNLFEDLTLQNTTRDGIDMKNNGDVGGYNAFNRITLKTVGKGYLPDEPFTGVDISGPGNTVTDLVCEESLTLATAGPITDPVTGLINTDPTAIAAAVAAQTIECVIRLKQGVIGDGRGQGAWFTRVTNPRIIVPEGALVSYGINAKDPFCRIESPLIRGNVKVGVYASQTHVSVSSPDIDLSKPDGTPRGYGVQFGQPGGSGTYLYTQADYAQVAGGGIRGCIRGVAIGTIGNSVLETVFEGCLSDVHCTSGASRPYVSGPGPVLPFTPVTWASGQAVVAGDLRFAGSKYYIAAGSGTTGATIPSHSSGTVSDGGVDWTFEAYNTRYHVPGDISPDFHVRAGTRGRATKITSSAGALSNIIEAFNGDMSFQTNYVGSFSGLRKLLDLIFVSGGITGLGISQGLSGKAVGLKPVSSDANAGMKLEGLGTGSVAIVPLASANPVDNGDMVFQATSNTSLAIKLKGTDGVIRSGTIALT